MKLVLFGIVGALIGSRRLPVDCWNAQGHEAIGMIAMSGISSSVALKLRKILGNEDITDVSNWAHKVEKYYPFTTSYHFNFQDDVHSEKLQIDERNCPQNQCLVRALQFFYGKLAGNVVYDLRNGSSTDFTDADALRFFINLIGELHQPTHLGWRESNAGRNTTVAYVGPDGERAIGSLFTYWDSDLILKAIKAFPGTWYGEWTHVQSIRNRMGSLRSEWHSVPSEKKHTIFETWAQDSFNLFREIMELGDIRMIDYSGDTAMDSSDFIRLVLVQRWLLTAGARLAVIMDDLFDNKDVGNLRQGTRFELPQEKSIRKASMILEAMAFNEHLQNFFINLLILLTIVGILGYVLKFYNPLDFKQLKNRGF